MPRIGLYPDAGKSRIRSNKTIQSLIQKNAAELRDMILELDDTVLKKKEKESL